LIDGIAAGLDRGGLVLLANKRIEASQHRRAGDFRVDGADQDTRLDKIDDVARELFGEPLRRPELTRRPVVE